MSLLIYADQFQKTKIYSESCPNNEYTFILYQVGSPAWPFGPVKAQIKVINSNGKTVDNKVDGKILTELRWHVIAYLNTLETVLTAWDLGIVDRKTVEEQFAFLKDTSKGVTLTLFRNIAGGYPVIEKFINTIKTQSNPPRDEL